jgi:hypothetical protein
MNFKDYNKNILKIQVFQHDFIRLGLTEMEKVLAWNVNRT